MNAKKIIVFLCCFFCIIFLAAFHYQEKKKVYEANKTPSLEISFDYAITTPLLRVPYISGVIDDPTDPAATIGIIVDVKENNKPIKADDYTLFASSDNTPVVHNDKIIIVKSNGEACVKIVPSQTGYSNITLTVSRKGNTSDLIIYYAASAAIASAAGTFWHTTASDASAAIALDSNYMLIGDDEISSLFVYHRYQSGLPVAVFNYSALLHLPDGDKEVDCEAGIRSLKNPEKIYWTGSMSNGGKNYRKQPNRNYFFETDISGIGSAIKFQYKGCYNDLRHQLIRWGDANGYALSKAAAYGMTSKRPDGFNIEGIAFAPDSSTLYIGFRAPVVPVTNRVNALIAPVTNFEEWFNNGHPKGNPSIGQPIELNLEGRSIRDLVHLQDGSYIIIAGNSDEVLNGALYTWSGQPKDKPVLVNTTDVKALKIESGMEIVNNGQFTGKVQVISDNGSNFFYNDNVEAKFLNNGFRKFRSDIINLKQE